MNIRFLILPFLILLLSTLNGFCQDSSQAYYDTPHGLVSVSDYFKKQLKNLLPKAEKGDAEAQCSLGSLYANNGKEEEGMKWFRKAALQGNAWAARMLGFYYEKKKDYKQTLYWRLKGADGGDPYLLMDISDMYEKGEGVDRNEQEAQKWVDKAKQTEAENVKKLKDIALKGDVKSQLEMANVYSTYNNINIPSDWGEAVKWWRMAASQNNTEAEFLLGLSYERGQGVQKDINEAFKWYKKAALQGDDTAQFQVGCMYLHGVGVNKDLKEAAKWFLKGARQGDVYSSYKIADIYRDDMKLGISPDELQQFEYRGMQRGDSGDPYRFEMLELEKKFNASKTK